MYKLCLLLLTVGSTLYANGQEAIRTYVEEKLVQIKTISPDSSNFSDLDIIGNAIGDSKIVMLGEQDHGDAPTFLAKTRMIRYLHEKKGFNVIAFESDFFGLNFGWDELINTPSSVSAFVHQNIFHIWTGCNTCASLFNNYIPDSYQTSSPLIVTGFDNQMMLNYSSQFLVAKLDSVLRSADLAITRSANYKTEILPLIDSLGRWYSFPPKDPRLYSKLLEYLYKIKSQASERFDKKNYWTIVIENLVQETLTYRSYYGSDKSSRNNRDQQMALNLAWLSQTKYPNEKIIVWAANSHIGRYADTASDNPAKNIISMGSFFNRDDTLLNNSYTIGFTSYGGEAGRLGTKKYSISNPRSNGFETWVKQHYDYAFVDFRKFRQKNPGNRGKFFLKGFGHSSFKTDWTNIFDGIFYIKTMYPCTR